MQVDGCVVDAPQTRVEPGCTIVIDGQVVPPVVETARQVWSLYKPPRVIVSRGDPQGRRTVYDLLPPSMHYLKMVGRLDFMSEGLLLLTNSGMLIQELSHPRHEVERRYRVRILGRADKATLEHMRCPVGHLIDGQHYLLNDIYALPSQEKGQSHTWLEVVLTEGKNREIRNLFTHFGFKIAQLVRISFGPYILGSLRVGQYVRLE